MLHAMCIIFVVQKRTEGLESMYRGTHREGGGGGGDGVTL